MPSRTRIPVVGLLMAIFMSGCILFPPFFPPAGFGQEGELVIENATDADWVLDLGGSFPIAFAVGAGEVGTVPVFAITEMELVLRRAEDCEEVDRLEWDGSAPAVRIDEPGTLSVLDPAPAGATRAFVEYWNCVEGSFIAPEPGDALPEAGGRILVFSTDGAPFALDVGEGTITQIAPDPEVPEISMDSYHAWSPDGDRLAFSRQEGADRDGVYLANADGSQPELVAAGGRIPRWSPDGTRIAYIVPDPFAQESRLEVLDLQSGTVVELATDASDAAWSPDGTRLAYITGSLTDQLVPEEAQLALVNADGSGLRMIAESVPYAPPPSWSPDGSRIAFTAPAEEGSFLIGADTVVALHEIATEETDVLAFVDGQSVSEPAWSRDGATLAVILTGMLEASGSIGLVDAESGDMTEIHETPETYYATPIWSPDGEWIAFTRTTNAGFTGSLLAVRPDGSGETVLATGMLIATQWMAGAP